MIASRAEHIRVLIVDDHASVRAGIRRLLRAAEDIVVVEEGANGAQALALASKEKPDVMLLDIELPDLRGDVVMRRIHATQPEIKVLAVTSYTDREYVRSMLENGAAGYITKDEAPAKLIEAIRCIIYNGKSWFSPQALKNSDLTPPEEQTLTQQEIKILRHLLLGQSEVEIAQALGLEQWKVGKFLKVLMTKFNVDSPASLMRVADRLVGDR